MTKSLASSLLVLLAFSVSACGSSESSSSPGSVGGSAGEGGSGEPDADVEPDADDASSKVCTPGAKESCYAGPAGTLGVGLCSAGTRTCSGSGQSWGECVGAVLPATETCSTPGDDDCDGETNEDGPGCSCTPGDKNTCYSGPPNTKNVGPCKPGTQACKSDGTGWGACQGEVTPAQESCATAIDDDCDGQVNEEGASCVCAPNASEACYDGPAGTEGVGICQPGTRLCNAQGTAWGACEGQVKPAEETCNAPGDDDCDGQTNEDGPGCSCTPGAEAPCYSGPANTKNVGPCKAGTQVCKADGTGWGECQGEVTPAQESCATPVDDDCDGQVNEEGASCVCAPNANEPCYDGPSGTEGVGVCTAGTRLCNDQGTAWGACEGQVKPTAESCLTQGDDDCDGLANEDGQGCTCIPGQVVDCYSGAPATQNVGPCKAGTQVCNSLGTGFGPCTGEVTPADETCSTPIDDDCDGSVNEGGLGCVCQPLAAESCYTGPSGSAGVGQCKAGSRTCNGQGTAWGNCTGEVLPSAETCNTLVDDDCDGLTNEEGSGCACVPAEVVACYSGPAGTKDVGPCHGGTQTCKSDGTGFAPCLGEVTPVLETCSTSVDDDCDGQVNESGSGCVCAPSATEPCYSGPSGTQGVGQCKAGTRTCNAQGTAWGACSGEVLPQAENCGTPQDEDCDGAAPPCGSVYWAKRFGDSDLQFATSVAADPSGNVLVTGGLYGSADFGGGMLTSAGDADVFAAKLSPQGDHLWSKRFGSNCNQQNATAIATDAQGNVYVAGYFDGAIDFGGGPLYGAPCASGRFWSFLAKLGPNGEHLWSKRFANDSSQESNRTRRMRVDAAGNIVITGSFNGKVEFGGGLVTTPQARGVFVARFDSSGQHIWSKAYGGPAGSFSDCYGLGVDPAGNVGIAGVFSGSIDLGGGLLTSAGQQDVFVARFDASGVPQWSKRFGGTSQEWARDAAVDGSGNVLVAGSFGATVDFGQGPVTTTGYDDGFVVKYDASGATQWSSVFTGSQSQMAMSVHADQAGNVIAGGHFYGASTFAGTSLTASNTNSEMFLVKLTSAGAPVWVQKFAGSASEYIDGIASDGSNNVLLAGSIYGTTTLGGITLIPSGSGDALVAKLAP